MKKKIIIALLFCFLFINVSFSQDQITSDSIKTEEVQKEDVKSSDDIYSSQPVKEKKKGPSYTASNNITYEIGDTIKLGRGSSPKGEFVYCQMGGAYDALSIIGGNGTVQQGLPKTLSGTNMVIKAIKERKMKGSVRTYFDVAGGNIVRYRIWIEDALATGEVVSGGLTSDEALEELKKAKDKYDLELITKDEYEAKKEELRKFIK